MFIYIKLSLLQKAICSYKCIKPFSSLIGNNIVLEIINILINYKINLIIKKSTGYKSLLTRNSFQLGNVKAKIRMVS